MRCKKCGFEMIGKPIDPGITMWKCPLGHKFTEWKDRPQQGQVQGTYPYNLEAK